MSDTVSDQIEFLTEAKSDLKRLGELKVNYERLQYEEKKYEKTIASEKKIVEDKIGFTIKQRKEEISSSYDREISKVLEKLKKVRIKREKAKSQGVKERIEEETAELREKNQQLDFRIKTLFQENGIPSYCNTALYYGIFLTKGPKEILVLILSILICFLAIPGAAFYMIPQKTPLFLIMIYFAAVLIFGGLYIIINNRTKIKNLPQLKEGREIRGLLRMNKKQIKAIGRSIKKDKSDEQYNLANYDDEIAQMEGEISAVNQKKKDALIHFENVTKNIIEDEINASKREKMEELESKFREIQVKSKETEDELKEKNIYITDTYESYIGRDSLNEERLDRLIEILENEEALNITEAIQMYKNKV